MTKFVDFEPGTFAKRFLTKLGITEDRYKDMKAAIGLPPNCSCKARAEWMNRAWKWAFKEGYEQEVRQGLVVRNVTPEPIERACRRGKLRTAEENAARLQLIQEGKL